MNITNEMATFFVKMYRDDERSLGFILTGTVAVETFLILYELFIKENGLVPIEDLPENKKKELVRECRATGQNFTNNSLINAAKVLHALKLINENN